MAFKGIVSAAFMPSTAYGVQEPGVSFDDGREIELLKFVYSLPEERLSRLRNNPKEILLAIDEFCRSKYMMNIGMYKAEIVRKVLISERPRTMVEVGGYIGYSAVAFGSTLKEIHGSNARLFCLERNPLFAAIMLAFINLAGLQDVVQVHIGESTPTLQRLHHEKILDQIDCLFLDHHKPLYIVDLKLCETLNMVRKGSVILGDNVIKPGNPPYLRYIHMSPEEKKKERLIDYEDVTKQFGSNMRDKYKAWDTNDKKQQALFDGRPDLIYDSTVINSFEPTGVLDGIAITKCEGVASV